MQRDEKKYKILVIEDNTGDFTLIEEYLKEQIILPEVVQASNFKEVKALLVKHESRYDVILLDLSLPDKSGEPLIDEIYKLCPLCPVIVLTGYADIEFSIKSLSLGISDYLLKDDITATSLYKSIIYSIERKKTHLELDESEKRYSNLFNLSPLPKWVYDQESFRFIQVNEAAIEHYGYSEAAFLDMTIMDIMPKEEGLKLKDILHKKNEGNENIFTGRFKHYKKSGVLIDIDIYSNQISFKENNHWAMIAIDVTEKILFDKAITKAIIKTQEDERYEIGSELHDNVCQLLVSSRLILGMMKKELPASSVKWFDQCNDYIKLASDEIRNLSHRLAPAFFDETSLEDTFKSLLKIFNIDDQYSIYLYFDNEIRKYQLHRDIQLNLYRILQEQLKNISKYALAKTIEVEIIFYQKNLLMRIADDGVGFDLKTTKRGIGLANIKRRTELFSGKLEIKSLPGKGCEINVKIPLQSIGQLVANSQTFANV